LVIRCERCSTMYELDESLLAPTGSEVQCTKCQHVFTAFPPKSAGRTLVGVPAQPQPPAPHPAPAAPAPAAPPASAPAAQAAAPGPAPAAAPSKADGAGPRPVRTSTPAVYRPQAGAGASAAAVPRAPVLKRDTVGTFEARLRWSARVRWLAPLAVAVLIVAIAAMWALLRRRGDAGAERTRVEALALLSLDDAASVDEAISRLGAVANRRPKLRDVAADRALALVIRAALTQEDAEAMSARAAELRDDRERARREQGPGWQDVERTASAETSRLEPEIRAREEKTRALSSGARDQLGILQAEAGETPEVLRALALLHALTGERDRLHRELRAARERGLRDPWIELADGWGDARDSDRAARERALVKLGALAAARPEILRGRFLLARAQLSLGRKAEALATAEGVLSGNASHEGAKRLREELAARAAPAAPPAPAPQAAASPQATPQPAPDRPAPRRRKIVAQPVPAPSVEPSAAPDGGGASGAASAPEPAAAPADPAAAPQPAPAAAPAVPVPPPPVPARRREPPAPAPPLVGDGG
jgi:predicted Zn finger-like uncharacterized protein